MAVEAYPSVHEGASSERSRLFWIALAGVVVVGGLMFGVAKWATPPNLGSATATDSGAIDGGAASVLAMVSIVAVAIERFIEMAWSLLASFKNGWWPLPEIAKAVDALAEETNQVAKPAFDAALAGLASARDAIGVVETERQRLEAEIAKVQTEERKYIDQIRRISSLSKDNQRVQLIATTAFQAANRLDTAYGTVMPAVRQAFNDASQVTAGISDILAGFKDNPAKKIISIFLGSSIGLAVCGVVGLDLFAAAGLPLGPTDKDEITKAAFPYVGVMLTGLVVGLGANPTHEVVRWVSEAAKSRRASNIARPNVSGSPDERAERNADAAATVQPAAGQPAEGQAAGARAVENILGRLLPNDGPAPSRAKPGTMNLR